MWDPHGARKANAASKGVLSKAKPLLILTWVHDSFTREDVRRAFTETRRKGHAELFRQTHVDYGEVVLENGI